MATQGGTRKFQGCTLTIASPAVITLQHEKTYMISLTEEEVVGLHAIFFDPTLILEIAEMDPENIFFGDDYVELRWKFEIGKRSHLVTIRLPEQSPGDCPGDLSPEGENQDIFELKRELKACQAQLAKCQADLSECQAPHVVKRISINDAFWLQYHSNEISHIGAINSVCKLLGTPYGKYTGLEKFFMSEARLDMVNRVDTNVAVATFLANSNKQSSRREIEFNVEMKGFSIASITLEPTDGFLEWHVATHKWQFDTSKFKAVFYGLSSVKKYVYLFRYMEQNPPEVYETVFDLGEIFRKKELELQGFFPKETRPKFGRFYIDKIPEMKIYKVRV